MKKYHMKNEGAYFTVEASLIFPIVMLFTTMMIFWAFYAYDRCILELSASQAAIRGTYEHIDKASESADKAGKSAALLVDNRVFAIKELSHDVVAKYYKVSVSYHCIVNMPFQNWLREYIRDFSDDYMTIDITKGATRIKPAKIIREIRTADKVIDVVDGWINGDGSDDSDGGTDGEAEENDNKETNNNENSESGGNE